MVGNRALLFTAAVLASLLWAKANAAEFVPTLDESRRAAIETTGLIEAVAQFERVSIPLLSSDSGELVDVFVDERFYGPLGVEIREIGVYYAPEYDYLTYTALATSLPVCPSVVTVREVTKETSILRCDERSYLSLSKGFEGRLLNKPVEGVTMSGIKGEFTFAVGFEVYGVRFEYSRPDLVARTPSLIQFRATLERQRQDETERQRSEEEQRRKAEEERRRAEAERLKAQAERAKEQRRATFANAVKQAVMLDGALALPVAPLAHVMGLTFSQDDIVTTCFDLADASGGRSATVCDESAWGTTNYVTKILSGRMYAPVEVIGEMLRGLAVSHDPRRALVTLKYFFGGASETYSFALAPRLASHRTVTKARIFPYRQADMPRCTAPTIRKPAYTLSIRASEEWDSLTLTLRNTSSSTILVVWDESSMVLSSGRSTGVMHEGVRFSELSQPQSPTPVAPGGTLVDMMVAKSTVFYGEYSKKWLYDLFYISTVYDEARRSITVSGESRTIGGSVALQVGGRRVYENFRVACTVKPGEFRF